MNYTYILIATLAQFVIGGLWYSPVMFGKKWMQIVGADHKSLEELKKEEKRMGPFYLLQIFLTFVFTCALNIMILVLPFDAYVTALFVFVGFIVPIQISGIIWGPTPRQLQFAQVLIVMSNQLVSMLVAAYILSF